MIRTSTHTIYHCIRSAFIDQGFKHPFILIEEITQELLKVEKDSYERIIRMMSHEVNNSVGAIGSTLNVVADIFKQDENGQWEYVLPAVEASFERCRHRRVSSVTWRMPSVSRTDSFSYFIKRTGAFGLCPHGYRMSPKKHQAGPDIDRE